MVTKVKRRSTSRLATLYEDHVGEIANIWLKIEAIIH